METINFWPILVAAISSFVIGAIWYSPILFGKEWASLIGMSDKDIDAARKNGVTLFYILQLIFTVVTMAVLGFAISAIGITSASDGAFIGLLAWVGFILPIGASMLMWEKKPFKLVLINTISILLSYVVGGAIIGAW